MAATDKRDLVTRIDRIDGGLLEPHVTAEGFLMVECRAAKPGIYPYRREDGSTYWELVDADVMHAPESILTVGGKPVTLTHPQDFVTPDTVQDDSIGFVDPTIDIEGEGGFVRLRLHVQRRDGIEAIRTGRAREVSMGYRAAVVDEAGEHPTLQRSDGSGLRTYDARQTWRGPYNHVAIVPQGRHGAEVRVRADGIQNLATDTPEEAPMTRTAILSLIAAAAPNFPAERRDALADALIVANRKDMEHGEEEEEEDATDGDMEKRIAALMEERDALKAKIADMEKDAKSDADDLAERLAFAKDRAALEAHPAAAKMDGTDAMDNAALRRAIVESVHGEQVKDGSDELILAHWQLMTRNTRSKRGTDGWDMGGSEQRADSAPQVNFIDEAEQAQRTRMDELTITSTAANTDADPVVDL